MTELMASWIETSLAELLELIESGSRPRGGVREIRSGIPSIGGEHLNYDGTFNFSSIKYVPGDFAHKMTKGRIRHNDTLIVKDGATTGKTAFVDHSFPFQDAVVNEHVFVCRPTGLISARFLFYYLLSKQGKNQLLKNFKGSAQGGINLGFAPNTCVALAPAEEQHRIAAKLEKLLAKVDKCKERLEKIPAILKRFRHSVLAAAYTGRLTSTWRKQHPTVETATALCKRIQLDHKRRHTAECANVKKEGKRKPVKPALLNLKAPGPHEELSSWGIMKVDHAVLPGDLFDGPFGSNLKTSDYTESGVRVIKA